MVGGKEYPEGKGRNKKEAKEAAAEVVYLQVKDSGMSEVCENLFYQDILHKNNHNKKNVPLYLSALVEAKLGDRVV